MTFLSLTAGYVSRALYGLFVRSSYYVYSKYYLKLRQRLYITVDEFY